MTSAQTVEKFTEVLLVLDRYRSWATKISVEYM